MNWYYLNATEETIGPLPESALQALRESGNIQDETRVCRDGDKAWRSFGDIFTQQSQDLQSEGDSFKFNCQHCGQSILAETSLSGTVANCPSCDMSILIPGDALIVETSQGPKSNSPSILDLLPSHIASGPPAHSAFGNPPPLPQPASNIEPSPASPTHDSRVPHSKQLVTKVATSTAARKLKPVMIAFGIVLLVGIISAVGVIFDTNGPANQTSSEKSYGSEAPSQSADNEAAIQKFQDDFGIPLDYESAIVYSTAHHIGANANPGTTLGQFLEVARQGSARVPQFQKVMEAGMRDGFEGRPNRIEGVKFDKSYNTSQQETKPARPKAAPAPASTQEPIKFKFETEEYKEQIQQRIKMAAGYLRFDGIYKLIDSDGLEELQFRTDGTVSRTVPTSMPDWVVKQLKLEGKTDEHLGKYTIENGNIELSFVTMILNPGSLQKMNDGGNITDADGAEITSQYKGVAQGDSIRLTINGSEKSQIYKFIPQTHK